MKVVILSGGQGTRLAEETDRKPKPMVEIGGWPILWHIMNIYAASNYKEFILALGYRGEIIKDYFLGYHYLQNNFSINLKGGKINVHNDSLQDWNIHFIDTGVNTGTGGRLKNLASWLRGETFMMTYGDGLAKINIEELAKFHKKHGKLATIMAVRPPARFGGLEFDGDHVDRFVEKPQIGEGWINGGFFVLEPEVLEYIDNEGIMFEQEPLEKLAQDRQLVAYRHSDFWQCMDTLRDVRLLNKLWDSKEAPWKVW